LHEVGILVAQPAFDVVDRLGEPVVVHGNLRLGLTALIGS
jgi:hypothetical protein